MQYSHGIYPETVFFTSLSSNELPQLAQLLEEHNITELSINSCKVDDTVVTELAKILAPNKKLTTLVLRENTIGDQGANALAALLRTNSHISMLVLEGNAIGDSGAKAFEELLRTAPPRKHSGDSLYIGLINNPISDDSKQALREAVDANLETKIELTLTIPGGFITSETYSKNKPKQRNVAHTTDVTCPSTQPKAVSKLSSQHSSQITRNT